MSDDPNNAEAYDQPPPPNPDLKSLDRLVGKWEVYGTYQGTEWRGTETYEWMEGDYFLVYQLDSEMNGEKFKGIEIIGHERREGEEPSEEITSHWYNSRGDTRDNVYTLEGDTLTAQDKGSVEMGFPAWRTITFGNDGNTRTLGAHYADGSQVWTSGEATATRVE